MKKQRYFIVTVDNCPAEDCTIYTEQEIIDGALDGNLIIGENSQVIEIILGDTFTVTHDIKIKKV